MESVLSGESYKGSCLLIITIIFKCTHRSSIFYFFYSSPSLFARRFWIPSAIALATALTAAPAIFPLAKEHFPASGAIISITPTELASWLHQKRYSSHQFRWYGHNSDSEAPKTLLLWVKAGEILQNKSPASITQLPAKNISTRWAYSRE